MARSRRESAISNGLYLSPLTHREVHEIFIGKARLILILLQAIGHRYGHKTRLYQILSYDHIGVIDALGIEMIRLLNLSINRVATNVVHALVN